jgi:SpoVK/Ycf46/Vps4 family AAA+-type ATPase
MRSPRRKSTRSETKSLVPLTLAHDSRFTNLVEVVEPTRDRDQLILSHSNVRVFAGLLEEYQHADTLRRHGLPIRSKLLFCGPPGCGKSITAEVFAHELGLPLIVARLDAIVSSFLGETSSNIRSVFETANKQPCVLFLDEFDALARARTDHSEHNELRRVVNSLLMLIDRFRGKGFLVAATNLEESLDAAIWRRFDEVLLFDLPRDREISAFLKLKTNNFPAAFNLDKKLEKLRGLSYADIERICLNAIKRSILKRSSKILETEFNLALREEQLRQEVRNRLRRPPA